MRAAVTGASGFVGRHVVNALTNRGVEVTAAICHGEPPAQSKSVRVVRLDIHQPCNNPSASLGLPDVLFHLAWAGLPHYDSPHHLENELPAQLSFLTACAKSGIRHIIVAGTCAEYGLAMGELSEDQPLAPVTCYAKAKAQLFTHMLALRERYNFALAWARIFYLFGPGQSPHAIYSQLNTAIANGDTTFDMSGGEQVRDYLPVEEAALLLASIGLDAGNVGAINICSGQPVALKALVACWAEALHSHIRMNLGRFPYSHAEPMAFWGSRTKLNRVLGRSGCTYSAQTRFCAAHERR